MSQENVETARRALHLVERGDIDQFAGMIGPGFELRENVLAPDAAVYDGADGLRKWLDAAREAFGEFQFGPERFIDRGDWVFASVHAHGKGRESGAPFTARYVTAMKLRLGKLVFAASYKDLSEAFEAAGLS